MDVNALMDVMRFQIGNFNKDHLPVTNDTVHNTILSETDGFGSSNSKTMYRGNVRWTIKQNGGTDKPWPADWFQNSISYLANKIA